MCKLSFVRGSLKTESSGQDTARGFPNTCDDPNLDYGELDGIPPLPLQVLLSAGDPFSVAKETSEISQVICSHAFYVC